MTHLRHDVGAFELRRARFVALCRKLEKKYGARFAPNKLLLDLASHDEGFYQRFAPSKRKEAA